MKDNDFNDEKYVLILDGEKTIYENKEIALYHISDLYHSFNGKERKYYKNIYNKIKNSTNQYSDGSIVKTEKSMSSDDYDNLPAIIVPAETLKGWYWHKYNDGSGSLRSSNGNKYMSYDLSTNEYKETEEEKYYDFFPLSYYYIDGVNPKDFKPFKYMEKEVKKKYYLKEKVIQFNNLCKQIYFRDIDMSEPHLESITLCNNRLELNCEKYSNDLEDYVYCTVGSYSNKDLICQFKRLDLANDSYVKNFINDLEQLIDWNEVNRILIEQEGDILIENHTDFVQEHFLPGDSNIGMEDEEFYL